VAAKTTTETAQWLQMFHHVKDIKYTFWG
jgi:hypothetical protein